MKNLSEIKINAQRILAEQGFEAVLEFLLLESKNEELDLYNNAVYFKSQLNALIKNRDDQLITKEEFTVMQNRLRRSVGEYIWELDTPKQKTRAGIYLTKEKLLKIILIFQIIIVLGIAVLIYLNLT